MSKETREHLSALVDGEIRQETSRFLVRRLGADEELRATWTRYHLVRDCLRHQDGSIAGDDLCARVSSALENEEPAKVSPVARSGWLKPFAGTAIAASVALMAIVAVGPGMQGTGMSGGDIAVQEKPAMFVSPQNTASQPNLTSAVSRSGGANAGSEKLNPYLLRHYQATGATGGKGFVTFVPIVITGSDNSPVSDSSEASPDPDPARDEDPASQ